jgi:two-component system, NtrC family, sensor histidine kinase GlrK
MKLGILERWALGYLAVFFLLAGSNFYALAQLHRLGTDTIPGMSADMRLLALQKRMVDSLLSQLRYERKFMLMKDEGVYEQFVKGKDEFHHVLSEAFSVADTAAKQGTLQNIETYQKRYEQAVNNQTELVRANTRYDEGQFRAAKAEASDVTLDELERLEGITRNDINERMGTVSRAGDASLGMALAASAASVFFALLASFFITRSITSPLRKLVTKTRDVAAGVFESDLRIASPPEISELNRAFNLMCEKLTAVDRLKGDFFSMVSHELRTPLTTINEGTSLLLEGAGGQVTAKQEGLLNILLAETNRLIRMVNSILDLSKMEAGMMAYALEPANMASLVEKAVTEIVPLIEARRIVLRKVVAEDLPPVRVDIERILQVLRNLLANAAKFTPPEGRITVAARQVPEGVEVRVEDSGPGISDDRLSTVFEKFSGTDYRSGTGLGLAIVKHIVLAHRGRVWIESALGEGSRFIFVIPLSSHPPLAIGEGLGSARQGRQAPLMSETRKQS